MSLPANGFPLAAAISPRLHLIESVASTNAKLLSDAVAEPEAHPHLSAVVTRDQTAGRGRLDRSWDTPPGSALAVSVLLRVGAVPVAHRGWIPLLAGEAMTRAVAAQLPKRTVALKWPNDVLVDRLKISGILAEVVPGDPLSVVLGAGVNTAMTAAQLPVPTATSFAAMGEPVDEDRLLADFLEGVRDGIAALAVADGGFDALRERIRAACATVGSDVTVSLPGGGRIAGRAVAIEDDGRLRLDVAGTEHIVSAGDVVHVR